MSDDEFVQSGLIAAIKTASNLEKRIVELERENAALRADKDRMDWLHEKIVSSWKAGTDFVIWDKSSVQPCLIRYWIDAARKEAQP